MKLEIRKIIVLGGGSAGLLAAITLKRRAPSLDVAVIHSSKIPIIGVGEGSTFTLPQYLHGYLGINPSHFHQTVNLWPPAGMIFSFEFGISHHKRRFVKLDLFQSRFRA